MVRSFAGFPLVNLTFVHQIRVSVGIEHIDDIIEGASDALRLAVLTL
jgi:hypothetical protein